MSGFNRSFMTAAPVRTIAMYAGIRTATGEGIVDSSAEDAVIGSGALQRLRTVSRRNRDCSHSQSRAHPERVLASAGPPRWPAFGICRLA